MDAAGGGERRGRAGSESAAADTDGLSAGVLHRPDAGDSDASALRIATAVLAGRLFTEVRSRRNLTYEVDAPFEERAVITGGLYVSTAFPIRRSRSCAARPRR